jgi:leader peptidase (prepilin peptidase)/N-methyltransferase
MQRAGQRKGAYWAIVETSGWVTIAIAAAAGLVAGRLAVVAAAWVPGREPGRAAAPAPGPAAGPAAGRRLPALRCPHGTARLRPGDLVPASGWGRLRGRCPACAAALGPRSLGAELLTAAVFAVLAWRFGPRPVLIAYCYLGAVGVALAIIDARYRRLPDALTLPSYPVALALLGVAALTTPGGGRHYLTALAGLAAAGLVFAAQALIYPAGLGWGDVKLAGLLGGYLGWLGVGPLVTGLAAGYLLAAGAGLALLAARRATRRTLVPFGPFLLAGALFAILLSGPVRLSP